MDKYIKQECCNNSIDFHDRKMFKFQGDSIAKVVAPCCIVHPLYF